MGDGPRTLFVQAKSYKPEEFDNHLARTLSSMRGQYVDKEAYDRMLATEDLLLYEVLELHRLEKEGELLSGLSIVHPGRSVRSIL